VADQEANEYEFDFKEIDRRLAEAFLDSPPNHDQIKNLYFALISPAIIPIIQNRLRSSDPDLVYEVHNHVLSSVWNRLIANKGPEPKELKIMPYIVRAIRNKVIDVQRRGYFKGRDLVQEVSLDELPQLPPSSQSDALEIVIRDEQIAIAQQLILQLPENERVVIDMAFRDMQNKDIAKELGISEKRVSELKVNALSKLRAAAERYEQSRMRKA
jgi:RNA polymerase sigma factor (sigma-70 family)